MDKVMDKIIENHKSKSEQVKKYQRKLKRQIPVSYLEQLLAEEKKKDFSIQENQEFEDDEDLELVSLEIERIVRIELLEELISLRKKDSFV